MVMIIIIIIIIMMIIMIITALVIRTVPTLNAVFFKAHRVGVDFKTKILSWCLLYSQGESWGNCSSFLLFFTLLGRPLYTEEWAYTTVCEYVGRTKLKYM